MGGVAGHGKRLRPGGLEPARHRGQHRRGILAPALEQEGDPRGNLRILVDDKMDMAGIVLRPGGPEEPLHQKHCRLRPHAAENADRPHAPSGVAAPAPAPIPPARAPPLRSPGVPAGRFMRRRPDSRTALRHRRCE
jgi:hypothetical protein